MKKLFLFLLCIVFFVPLSFGQMVVRGDIKVSNTATGILRANTPVVLRDSSKSLPAGKIFNSGALSMGTNAKLVFCSNYITDGMIIPDLTATYSLSLPSDSLSVVKNFANQRDLWISMSFPFNVSYSDIINPNINPAIDDDNFAIAQYNSQSRADYGLYQGVNHWEYINPGDTLYAGRGYRAILTSACTDSVVVFPAAGTTAISDILACADKTTPGLQYYTGSTFPLNWGWNYIGGLNPCAFQMSSDNFVWQDTAWNSMIYYMVLQPDSSIVWDELIVDQQSDTILSPFVSFFVQIGGPIDSDSTFIFKSTGLSSSVAFPGNFRSANKPERQVLYMKLTDNAGQFGDRMFMYLGNRYHDGYNIGEDGQKLLSSGLDSRMRLWSIQENVPLTVNAFPLKDGREIPIGFSVPKAGNYSFAFEDRNSALKTAHITDKLTGETIDILSNPYTFNVGQAGSTNERFVIVLNKKSGTEIDPVHTTAVYAFTVDSRLMVKNLIAGDHVQVMDLAGRLILSGVAQGETFSHPLTSKGVYMINVKGNNRNVVLKVLNH